MFKIPFYFLSFFFLFNGGQQLCCLKVFCAANSNKLENCIVLTTLRKTLVTEVVTKEGARFNIAGDDKLHPSLFGVASRLS